MKIAETIVGLGFCGLMFAVGIHLTVKTFQAVVSLIVLGLMVWAVTKLVHKEKEIDFDEVEKLLKEHMPTAKIVKGVFK
jgi:hypothetical protein